MTTGDITITGYPDTRPEMIQQYCACIVFMACWLEQQDGANGKSTEEQFDEFKSHVCDKMRDDAKGTG